MNEEEIEKIKDLKAVYGGAIEAGELSIANIIKNRNRFNRKTTKRE